MSRNQPRTIRNFRDAYGEGPWACHWCEEEVSEIGGGIGDVHHIDHDCENDDPSNLAVGHVVCHQRHHHAGVPKSTEHRAKTGRKGRKILWSDKIQKARRDGGLYEKVPCPKCGKPIAGGIGNMRQHQAGPRCGLEEQRHYERCEDCGKEWSGRWITGHKSRGLCVRRVSEI